MPNLPSHIELAWRASGELSDSRLTQNMGCYLLGSTAPDVRIITKRPRADTHFFELGSGQPGDGVAGLFAAHPELRSPESDAQAAFVAGYITHLVADETWIVSMYRRHFELGPDGAGDFDSRDAAQLFDRAAQLLMDIPSETRVKSLLPEIESVEDGLAAGPVSAAVLTEWRAWVLDFLAGDSPYRRERLRHMASRISGRDSGHVAHDLAERFIADVPGGLETLYERVSRTEIDGYRDRVIAALVETVGDYLASSRASARSGVCLTESTRSAGA